MPLGNFLFVPGQNHRVELSDDANGNWIIADAVRFVRNDNASIVKADAIKIVPNTAEDALYVHADHLGTPQKMTDDAAAVVWDATYRPFGSEDAITGTATNEQRFPGQFRDAETGLHYNYFRDYEPAIGRYVQSDPIGLGGGLNTYAYANQNPQRFRDPKGLSPAECFHLPPDQMLNCLFGDSLGPPDEFLSAFATSFGESAVCTAECVMIGEAQSAAVKGALEATAKTLADGAVKKLVRTGLHIVRVASPVFGAYGNAKCLVDCFGRNAQCPLPRKI